MRELGLGRRVAEHPVQGLLVAGQQPTGDLEGRPGRGVGDGDAVRFLDAGEVVGTNAVAVGFERGDDELAGIQGAVSDVEPLAVGAVEDGVVVEDVLADDVIDVTEVPELLCEGELVRVPRVALVLTGPGAGQACGKLDGEGSQVGAGGGHMLLEGGGGPALVCSPRL